MLPILATKWVIFGNICMPALEEQKIGEPGKNAIRKTAVPSGPEQYPGRIALPEPDFRHCDKVVW